MATRTAITPQLNVTINAVTLAHTLGSQSTAAYFVRVANGATPPTSGCLVTVFEKHGADRVKLFSVRAGTVANGIDEWPIEIDPACSGIEVDFGATDQVVTKTLAGTELVL